MGRAAQRRVVGAPLLAALLLASGAVRAQAPAALSEASELLSSGRYEQARSAYLKLTQSKARSRALLGLSRLELETGNYEQAERAAERALRAGADVARAHTLIGEARKARGRLDPAAAAFRHALSDSTAFRARVLLGRLLMERGRERQAEQHLMALISAYNDDRLPSEPAVRKAAALSYVAMAARALGSMHDANDAFREAALADRSRVETQLEWASLFLEKYDKKHATESVEEALEHNPHHPVAHALMARLVLARAFDFPTARKHIDKALAVNPNLAMAHVTLAAMALRNMDLAGADQHLERALSVDPNDLEALSVRAAVRFLADDKRGFERAKREVLKRNPRFSRMYSIIAEYAEWEHRYEQLVKMAREALAIDDDDALAHATLGINLLRSGEEEEGLKALHEAWDRDRFNVHVYNILNLYDHVISQSYEQFDAKPFTIRIHKEERASLEPYLVPMLRKAYDDMKGRYRYTPRGPLHIELYADRQHFSVRTTGLPNVGVQGVCFGKVITALSPRGGPFNWGQITWHELAHVFHLQLSDNHVPRWFTEGLAEYETVIARTEWRREEDHNLWVALRQGRVPHLRDLNAAFTSARDPDDLMTAYYVASQVVSYIVERFGFDKVRPMLEAWGRGLRTPEVAKRVLGVDIDRIDTGFREHTRKRLAKYDSHFFIDFSRFHDLKVIEKAAKDAPNDAAAQADLATAYVMRGRYDDAARAGGRALKLDPHNPRAHFALTRVALERGDIGQAERCLQAILDQGHDGYVVRILLARAALAGDRPKRARAQALAAIALDADQDEAYRVLLDVAEKTSDDRLALRALTDLARLDQHDRMVHFALMTLLSKNEEWSELVRIGENALYVDPGNAQLHRLLGEGYVETGKAEPGLRELDQALALGYPKPARPQLLRARALLALGRRDQAKAAAKAALAADASLAPEVEALLGPTP